MDHEQAHSYFLKTYDAYADDIFRFCRCKVSPGEVAEDITQETFTRFWQALREGTVMRNDRALLYTIARNLIIDWYRKKKESSLDTLLESGLSFAGDDESDVTLSAEAREVLEAVHTLDTPSQEAVLMRFVQGLSPQEIATLSGETANAVSVRINRALKKVRASLNTP